jgi:IS5 family transposase
MLLAEDKPRSRAVVKEERIREGRKGGHPLLHHKKKSNTRLSHPQYDRNRVTFCNLTAL